MIIALIGLVSPRKDQAILYEIEIDTCICSSYIQVMITHLLSRKQYTALALQLQVLKSCISRSSHMSDRAILLPAKFPIMLTRREYLKFKVIVYYF